MSSPERKPIVDRTIRERCTTKVYAVAPLDRHLNRQVVNDLLETAGWAPFHRVAAPIHTSGGTLSSPVPWRFYVLDGKRCRRLRQWLLDHGEDRKVPRMLAAATTLIQVTWLPDQPKADYDGLFEPTIRNMEHIAAASAAIQNLLLAACARAIPTYWSSGSVLRNADAFAWLGIPNREILLGSVYLFPQDLSGIETVSGSLREKRGDVASWARWID